MEALGGALQADLGVFYPRGCVEDLLEASCTELPPQQPVNQLLD